MSFFSWLCGRIPRTGGKCKPRPKCRLRVETLEDRAMLASFSAATVPELIAAIDATNLTAEADTISLAASGRYTLTAPNNATAGANGLPVITAGADLTILGNDSIIERSTASGTPPFRLFNVAAGASLTLENQTLQGGVGVQQGGAILNEGTLTLRGVTVQNNFAFGVSGINNFAFYVYAHGMGGGIYSSGSLTLESSTVKNNQAKGGTGGRGCDGRTCGGLDGGHGLGGGIYAADGTVTLRDSRVTDNVAQGGAGGGTGRFQGRRGQAIGGGLYLEPDVSAVLDAFTASNVKRNKASTSDPNIHGPYTIG